MATTPIRQLTENGKDILPVTHQRAVYDDEGHPLDFVIGSIRTGMDSVAGYLDATAQNASRAENQAAVAAAQASSSRESLEAILSQLEQLASSGTADPAVAAQIAQIRAELSQIDRHVPISIQDYEDLEARGALVPGTYYNILEE